MYHEKDIVKNEWLINRLIETFLSYNIDAGLVTVEQYAAHSYTVLPDAVIARMINPYISKQLEDNNVRVFNSSKLSNICNNKAETMRLIHKLGIEHIPTIAIYDDEGKQAYEVIAHENMEVDLSNAHEYVIKSVTGHGGKEVFLLSDFLKDRPDYGEQEKNAASFYSDKYIIQPLINCNGRDMRVYIIGNEIIGAVLRQTETGFKSNYSLGGHVSLYNLKDEQKNIIYSILDNIDIDYGGIDFLVCGEEDRLVFNEIEDVVGARMLSECSDIDYVNIYVSYILKELTK